MRAFVALCVISSAYAAPAADAGVVAAGTGLLTAGTPLLGAGYAGYAGLAPAAVGLAAAPVAAVAPVAPAPVPAVSLPAPYSVDTQAAGVTTFHQPAPVVTKETHFGTTNYVSGYTTAIHKPPTPHLPIAVPTVLKGSQSVGPAVVKTQVEVHTVNEPVYVERRVEVPYDVPVYKEQIVEVPTPVHVDAPYAVPHPVPVAGEPIIQKKIAQPIVTSSHHGAIAAPGFAGYAGYAAGAPLGLAVAGVH